MGRISRLSILLWGILLSGGCLKEEENPAWNPPVAAGWRGSAGWAAPPAPGQQLAARPLHQGPLAQSGTLQAQQLITLYSAAAKAIATGFTGSTQEAAGTASQSARAQRWEERLH